VRSMLIWVVVACLLPAVIGIGALVSYLYHDGHADLEKETLQISRALVLAIDEQLDEAQAAIEMLATSAYVLRNDWAGFHARASEVLQTRNSGRNAIISDSSGQEIVNTRIPIGLPLPMFGDLDHIRRVVATGKPAISDLFIGAVSGQHVISVSVPAFVDGKVAYVISVGIPVQQLNQILAGQKLPSQWMAGIVDASGTIVARTHKSQQFVGTQATNAFIQRMHAQAPEGMLELTTIEGIPSLTLYSRSILSGLTVATFIPRVSLEAQLMRTLAFFGLGIVVLFGAGIALAWFMGGRIARSVQALKMCADAMGTGQSPLVSRVHFREADDVAQAMTRSAGALTQRTQLLQTSLASLKASEENYRILADGSPDAIVLHQDGKNLYVNPTFVKLVGDRPAPQWMGQSILDFVDPAFHPALLNRMTLLSNFDVSAALPMLQITCLKLDGTPFQAEIHCVPVDYQGQRAVHTTLRDVTVRTQAEEERKQADAERLAEALFHRRLLDQLPIGVALRTLGGDFIDVNPAFAEILDLPREQILGMANAQVTAVEYEAQDAEQTEVLHRTGRYGPYEKEYLRRDGSRIPVRVRGQHLERNGEMLILSVAEDISDKRMAEFRLAQAQKMDAIGQLTGGLAHDFNNMLGVIIGNLDLLADDFADDLAHDVADGLSEHSAARARVDTALMAALRGADLTRALLAVARAQSVVTEPVDLNARLGELLPLLRHTAGPNIEVSMALAAGLVVQIDCGGLAGTLLNLVINARDAMPCGGRLTLSMHVRIVTPGDSMVTLAPGQYAALSVTDTGSGMSAAVMANATLPFFTTKERGRGTGLGLAMAHGFVKQCGGELLLYSEPGHGTTVKLILPLALDWALAGTELGGAAADVGATQIAVQREADASALARGAERVLVVDDEIELLAVTASWLKMLGYEVTPCTSAASALAALSDAAAVGRPYALMVSDVIMPGMDGFALAHAARAQQPDLALLYVSGFADAADRGRERPFGTILEKPFRQAALAALVRSTLDGHLDAAQTEPAQ
jgi:PAS domain S-box-containing protein